MEEIQTPILEDLIFNPKEIANISSRITKDYTLKQEVCSDMFNLEKTYLDKGIYAKYIKPYPKEKDYAYTNRLQESLASNYYSVAVTSQAGIILDKYELAGAVTFDPDKAVYDIAPDVPIEFKEWFLDMTGKGETLHTIINSLSVNLWKEGCSPWIIDYTVYDKESIVTQLDLVNLNLRPYLNLIPSEDVLEVVTDEHSNIVRLRFKKEIYGKNDVIVTNIYAYDIDLNRTEHPLAAIVYSNEGAVNGAYKFKTIEKIPHGILAGSLALYPIKSCPLLGDPPFIELALLQSIYLAKIGEWSSTTGIAMIPFLIAKGFNSLFEDANTPLDYGPAFVLLAPPNAELSYVEITGKSLEMGLKCIEFFQRQCETSGGLSLENSLATTVVVSQAPTHRLYNNFLANLTHTLNRIMDFMCIRHGLTPPKSRISFVKKPSEEITDPTNSFIDSTKAKAGV